MPMKTTFDNLSPRRLSSLENRDACSKISALVKCLEKPIWPVAQKVQPMPQPACDEMQAVLRPSLYGINTLSITEPSRSSYARLIVPSL